MQAYLPIVVDPVKTMCDEQLIKGLEELLTMDLGVPTTATTLV